MDPTRGVQAKDSPTDVVTTSAQSHPSGGTSKIGNVGCDVTNGSPRTVEELNDLPLKTSNCSLVLIRDVAHVRNGYPTQTNIARVDGQRAALVVIQKTGSASTLDVIARVKAAIARVAPSLPPALEIKPMFDQSVFVRASIQGVVREAVIAACLTALMILVFLGSWRSTIIIAVSIPLSILTSIIALSALGETINIMTLGGLALAVGILVDDATVAIENINSHLEEGKDLEPAILEGAQQIAVPAFVSTICICIVFVPMFFLTGVAKFLFVPMAEAVVFAMLASYVLSRTLVPTMAKYLLKAHAPHGAAASRNPFVYVQRRLDAAFLRLRAGYRDVLEQCVGRGDAGLFLLGCLVSLADRSRRRASPPSTAGSSNSTCALRPARASKQPRSATASSGDSRVIPADSCSVIDNIGLPYINLSYRTLRRRLVGCRRPRQADRASPSDRALHP